MPDAPAHPAPALRLGIDFDNTIVCYDALFHRIALEDGWIPRDLPANKSDVRNHLRAIGREDVWTEMQGRVYGARMNEADPYPGVLEFFRACLAARLPVYIVSHKTLRPFAGEPYDLHAAARGWLESRGFFDPQRLGLPRDHVFFELTKAAKLGRIDALGCTHFIDDLPEFLAEAAFPTRVDRILFDPNRLYPGETRFRPLHDWSAAAPLLGLPPAPPLPPAPAPAATPAPSPEEAAAFGAFLQDAGLPPHATWEPLPGGANNRVFRVRSRDAGDFVLKRYFHDPADPRDRFGTERAFYRWAWGRGIRRTPEPIAWDASRRLGLFRFIEGRKLGPGDIDASTVAQAVAFVSELNARRDPLKASELPVASEASFSLAEHLDRIGRRVARLNRIAPDSDLDREAAAFANGALAEEWQAVRQRLESSPPSGIDPHRPLPAPARCLSPSDFGFHNALLAADGRLRFFDFEYAGWDDPAKTVCDFFCQPQIPVDLAHWDAMVAAWDRDLGDTGLLDARARCLLPAYRIKWCCIVLNEFLHGDQARRRFARGDAAQAESRKRTQLAKARQILASLDTLP